MSSALSAIPVERRRRVAATLGLLSVLSVTVGVVAMTGTTPGVVRVFSGIALLTAVLLGLIAWGVAHSVKLDETARRRRTGRDDAAHMGDGIDDAIDRAIDEALSAAAARGDEALVCGCGHDHDMDEMHVEPEPRVGRHAAGCDHDGAGTDCAHSCDSCVLNEVLSQLRRN